MLLPWVPPSPAAAEIEVDWPGGSDEPELLCVGDNSCALSRSRSRPRRKESTSWSRFDESVLAVI
jgi:hypothetical protein